MTPAEHIDAFIDTFVKERYRVRLHKKHRDFLDELCHKMVIRLVPQCLVPLLPAFRTPGSVEAAVLEWSGATTACFLGAWSGCTQGDYPIGEAVALVESVTGSAASIEPGQLAFYKPEFSGHGRGEKYLLVRDPARRSTILKGLAAPARTTSHRGH